MNRIFLSVDNQILCVKNKFVSSLNLKICRAGVLRRCLLKEKIPVWFFIFSLVSLLTFQSFAADRLFPSTKIGGYYSLFSGEKNSSLSGGNSGVGAEIAIDSRGTFLSGYIKGHVISTTGRQTFLDGTNEITASFSMYQTTGELGFHLFPLVRRESSINIYFGAAGSLAYNFLTLSSPTATLSELKANDQSTSVGTLGLVGAEWIIGKKLLYSEVGFRNETTNLAGNNKFKLNSLSVSVGFGW
jgi:hypothetical protein